MPRKSATDTPGNGAQLAKLLNLTLPQCYNLANSGTIPSPDNGVWDLAACAHAYIKYLQGRAGEEKRDYAVERTRLTKAQADKVEMEIKVLEGKLLGSEIVEKVWSDMVLSFKSKILGMPSRAAFAVLSLNTPSEIEKMLEGIVYEALSELSNFESSQYSDKMIEPTLKIMEVENVDDPKPRIPKPRKNNKDLRANVSK